MTFKVKTKGQIEGEKLLVPKLRFKEFHNKWIKLRLKDISNDISYGMNSAATDFDGINKYIRITDINEDTSLYNNSNPVSPAGYLDDKFLLQENDILFARTGASTGKTYLYNKDDGKLYFAGFLIRASIKKDYNSRFVFEQTKLNKYNNWVKIMSMRSGQPGINSTEYGNYEISITNSEEQEKIAKFVSLLDKKIELQQRRIEALKIYKKGLIQKLKYRSQNWNEYKIKNLFEITRGQVIPKNSLKVTPDEEYKYPVYSSQTSNYGILGYDKTYDFDGKFLTWTTDGANAGKVFYRNGKFRCTNVCGLLYSPTDSPYINLLTADLLNYETPKHVSYVGNPKLMNNVMADIKIKLPSIEIQNKISNIFSVLNNKLLIEENKLKNLNTMKKSLLQQMFI